MHRSRFALNTLRSPTIKGGLGSVRYLRHLRYLRGLLLRGGRGKWRRGRGGGKRGKGKEKEKGGVREGEGPGTAKYFGLKPPLLRCWF